MSQEEKRLHTRVNDKLTNFVEIMQNNQSLGIVKDISYGGLLLELNDINPIEVEKNHKITLKILDKTIEADIRGIYKKNNSLGCSINHTGVETLLFLREFLEPWRLGTTGRIIKSDKAESKDTVFINAEGPVDLIITPQNSGCEYRMTFLSGGTYKYFSYKDSSLQTGVGGESSKLPGALMNMDQNADKDTIREVICILLGLFEQEELKKHIEPLLTEVEKLFG